MYLQLRVVESQCYASHRVCCTVITQVNCYRQSLIGGSQIGCSDGDGKVGQRISRVRGDLFDPVGKAGQSGVDPRSGIAVTAVVAKAGGSKHPVMGHHAVA